MIKIFSPDLSVKEQLQQLFVLRLFYLVSEIIVVGLAQSQFDITLPWSLIWLIVIAHLVLTNGYYLISRRQNEVSSHYLYQSILIDILMFSGLLYFSGGATNGAVSILLLPVATAAALFTWRASLSLAVIAIGCYSVLMWHYYPMTDNVHAHHQPQEFSIHLLAMWFTFIFSCLLLVWFIGLQSHLVRQKNEKLSTFRENQLRDEQLIAIATFAANAAHDLATPLSSISLLSDELKHEEGKEGIDTLIDQVELCRTIVQSISHKAIMNKSKINQSTGVANYFGDLIERWLITRPEIILDVEHHRFANDVVFTPDSGLESAMTNILDNAADASVQNGQSRLNLSLALNQSKEVVIKIRDFGIGIDDDLINLLGKEPVQSNHDGMGLGQFLANSTIQRCGGKVWRHSGVNGTQTEITLPLGG